MVPDEKILVKIIINLIPAWLVSPMLRNIVVRIGLHMFDLGWTAGVIEEKDGR